MFGCKRRLRRLCCAAGASYEESACANAVPKHTQLVWIFSLVSLPRLHEQDLSNEALTKTGREGMKVRRVRIPCVLSQAHLLRVPGMSKIYRTTSADADEALPEPAHASQHTIPPDLGRVSTPRSRETELFERGSNSVGHIPVMHSLVCVDPMWTKKRLWVRVVLSTCR